MKNIVSVIILFVLSLGHVYSINGNGDAVITIFSDFHSGFGSSNDDRGFGLERAYIGYGYKLPQDLEIKAVMDFGMSDDVNDSHRIGFIKNVFLRWKRGGLTLSGGMISTTQFKFQESFWGKRYVMKSFQDEYGFGSSADLAVSAEYKVNDFIAFDGIVANGEGYKQVQVDDGLLYGVGLTLGYFNGFVFRAYASYNEAADGLKTDEGVQYRGEVNLACFAGFRNEIVSLGVEYNMMMNSGFVNDANRSGTSVYATVNLNDNIGLYGRWDYLSSKESWDKTSDGMAGIAGLEIKLGEYVRLSPNFRIWKPFDDSVKNQTYFYLNASFAL